MPELLEPFTDFLGDANLLPLLFLALGLPALAFAARVRNRFKETLDRNLQVACRAGLTGVQAARKILEHAGVRGVRIKPTQSRWVTDHYHPLTRELALSHAIYHSASLGAVGIAAHEAGHAVQHARGFHLLWLRTALVPLTHVCFYLGVLAVGLGLVYSPGLAWVGLALFGGCVVFPFVVLPVERGASARARQLALEAGVIGPEELEGVDQVLRAAALTYVAQAVKSALGLLLLLLFLALGWDHLNALADLGDSGMGPLFVPMFLFFVVLYTGAGARKARKAPAPGATDLNNTGSLLADQGDDAEAVAAFTRALDLNPNLAAAYVNRGAVYLRTGRLDEALADLNAALRLVPGLADANVGRGNAHLARGELDQALADYDEALRRAPDRLGLVHGRRGDVWLVRGDYERAAAEYTASLEHGGNRAADLRDRGLARLLGGDAAGALADLDESIRLCGSDAVAFNNRGAAHLKRGDYARALADLRQAVRLNPKLPNPYKHLAWLQATCPEASYRDGAAAVDNALRAWRLSEGRQPAWRPAVAAAYAEAGNFEEAVRWQEQCVAEAPAGKQGEEQERLALYRTGQAFRDVPAQPVPVG